MNFLLLLLATTVFGSTQQAELLQRLTSKAVLMGVANNVSVYFKDLNSNLEVTIDANREWVPASIIKVFVALEAFRQKQLGLINFDQKTYIKTENVVPTSLETYEFPELKAGVRISIRDLVETMIVQSDNTAFNTLIDILDRRNISLTLRRFGFFDTVIGEKLSLGEDQGILDATMLGHQANKTTAADLGRFYDLLFNDKLPGSTELLAMLKRQKVNYMLPALLPLGTVIAHKTGESSPYYHDGGIIYKSTGPFVLVIMTDSGDSSLVSRLAYEVFLRPEDRILGKTTSWWDRIIRIFLH